MTNGKASTTISVPIKPHLKKFYLKTYELTEPVKLEEDTILGSYVMSVLQDKRGPANPNFSNKGYISELITDTLKLSLSDALVKRSPRISKLIRINIFLQHIFKLAVIVYIKASIKSGVNAYTACKMFLETYNFDESDYTLDGIQKIWTRHCAKDLKKKGQVRTKKGSAVS